MNGFSPRRSFRDAKIQKLENMASDIAVGMAVLAAAKTEDRLRRQAAEQKREDERRQREAIARNKHIRERRAAGLSSILTELEELVRLRHLTAKLEAEISAENTPRLSSFLAWTKEHMADREARLSAPAIEKRFEEESLFGHDDDHGFVPSRW